MRLVRLFKSIVVVMGMSEKAEEPLRWAALPTVPHVAWQRAEGYSGF